jgi:2-polyprenyl-6-methoxyphenol hydroxylase-like FAD-dependent oxidoreductase
LSSARRPRALAEAGSPVDVRGEAVDMAEQMGVMGDIRSAATTVTDVSFVNATGKRVGKKSTRALQGSPGGREVEVPRGDLSAILHEANRDRADFMWADSIDSLRQDELGVGVTFEHAEPRRFGMVIGADGLH